MLETAHGINAVNIMMFFFIEFHYFPCAFVICGKEMFGCSASVFFFRILDPHLLRKNNSSGEAFHLVFASDFLGDLKVK
jgi:hypothetical protein